MTDVVLYIMAKQNVEAKNDEILLGDAASIYCEDSAVRAKANAMRIYKFREGQEPRAVISMMKIIEMPSKGRSKKKSCLLCLRYKR